KVLLRLEVAVHDELGDAGSRGDLVHRRGRVPALTERRGRRLQEGLAARGGPPHPRRRGRTKAACHGGTLAFTLSRVSNLVLSWSEAELLETDDIAEPLVAKGVRCHGGYTSDGRYVSPRTKNRVPAIAAWQQSHREQFGSEILTSPIADWPDVYPNV